jgi:hypothetical protein
MTVFRSILGLALAAALALPAGMAAAGAKRPVVVELYTSQGCSSCPPADALLGQLAQRKDVLAMSLPITYWDMLGWKDTLASDANTRRQKAYAAAMGRGGIYTPQMIVDGVNDVVGSREPAVQSAVDARLGDMRAIAVALSASPQEIHISVGPGNDRGEDATIWLFHILSHATVAIHAGENEGHSITYRNIVRDVKAVGVWKGQAVSLDLPRQEITSTQHDSIAVVVQQGGYGRVVGAAFIGHPEYAPAL